MADMDAPAFGLEDTDVTDTVAEDVNCAYEGLFTTEELQVFLKVFNALGQDPDIIKRIPQLQGLEVERAFQSKKERKMQWKKENKEKVKAEKERDAIRVRKTEMRKQRDEALQKLLDALPNESDDNLKLEYGATTYLLTDGNGAAPSDPTTATVSEPSPDSHNKVGETDDNLSFRRKCHICAQFYKQLHYFYDSLCPKCAEYNFTKRNQTRDLTGQVALVTGGRIKIGYQVVLKLLRAGAEVIVTTRFPHDAAKRFELENDFVLFKDRLHVYGLDLRDLASIERFVEYIKSKFNALHILINNAAQTVARPSSYYQHLVNSQPKLTEEGQKLLDSKWLDEEYSYYEKLLIRNSEGDSFLNQPAIGYSKYSEFSNGDESNAQQDKVNDKALPSDTTVNFDGNHSNPDELKHPNSNLEGPVDMYDIEQCSLDLRRNNSWLMTLEQVSAREAAECHAINALAPFILNSKLKPIMKTTKKEENKFIVNVSAMEGQFYRFKNPRHPHTNMAKASLNMLTRTSASDYMQDRIYMNSVDTGWITDENPIHITLKKINGGFQPPLDEIDAPARILDPVFANSTECGKFYKNYFVTPW